MTDKTSADMDIRPALRRVLPLLKRLHQYHDEWQIRWGHGTAIDIDDPDVFIIDDPEARKLAEFIESAEQLLLEE